MEKNELLTILSGLAKKGFYEVLFFVSEERTTHYSDVLEYVRKNRLARSDATVTQALKFLSDHELLKRTVSQDRPIRTTYELTDRGKEFVDHITQLQDLGP